MICQHCWYAGQRKHFVNLATAAHAKCKGGTWCDCQHKVQDLIAGRADNGSSEENLPRKPAT